jgi:hypothetical protein
VCDQPDRLAIGAVREVADVTGNLFDQPAVDFQPQTWSSVISALLCVGLARRGGGNGAH